MLIESNWLVISGGPGLSVNYLKNSLKSAFLNVNLHFYDQLGSPEAKTKSVPTINELVDQIFNVAAQIGWQRFGIITHSFGNYLAMRVLERAKNNISAIVMISPMPLTYSNWHQSLQQLAKKIPQAVLEKIQELVLQKNSGAKIFSELFPYYTAKTVTLSEEVPFDLIMCNEISNQVKEYDDRELLISSGVPFVCIVGEKDPFLREKEFDHNLIVIPEVGHYPFLEDRNRFVEAISKFDIFHW